MKMLNRNAIVVSPRQPYVHWANGLDGDVPALPSESDEVPTYLLPEFDTPDEVEKWLRRNYKVIFENELRGMWEDETSWPKIAGYGMFREWFDIRFGSEVFDLGSARLKVDDM
jgi:hypothetical protein